MVFLEGRGRDLLIPSCNVIDAPLGIVFVSFAMDVVVHGADHLYTHQLLSFKSCDPSGITLMQQHQL